MSSIENNSDVSRLARGVSELQQQLKARSVSEDHTLLLTRLVFNLSMALAEQGALQTILKTCCETLVQELGVSFARVWTLRPRENVLHLQASAGLYTHLNGGHACVRRRRFQDWAHSLVPQATSDQ
jgi:hypothetical protein